MTICTLARWSCGSCINLLQRCSYHSELLALGGTHFRLMKANSPTSLFNGFIIWKPAGIGGSCFWQIFTLWCRGQICGGAKPSERMSKDRPAAAAQVWRHERMTHYLCVAHDIVCPVASLHYEWQLLIRLRYTYLSHLDNFWGWIR